MEQKAKQELLALLGSAVIALFLFVSGALVVSALVLGYEQTLTLIGMSIKCLM